MSYNESIELFVFTKPPWLLSIEGQAMQSNHRQLSCLSVDKDGYFRELRIAQLSSCGAKNSATEFIATISQCRQFVPHGRQMNLNAGLPSLIQQSWDQRAIQVLRSSSGMG